MIPPSKTEIQYYTLPVEFNLDKVNQIQLTELVKYFGYTEDPKKSTPNNKVYRNSIEDAKIIIKNNRYFNVHDDLDKGSCYNFIINRLNGSIQINQFPSNFDKRTAFVIAAQYLNIQPEQREQLTPQLKTKESTIQINQKDLFQNLNIKPLLKKAFLFDRGITLNTLNDPKFKDKIFNSIVQGKNPGSSIPNIAFPLTNPNTGKTTGFEIRNKDFKKIEGNHLHLWHSNAPAKIMNILYSESVIDSLSHYQLNKDKNQNSLYFSFSGNIYKEKIESFLTQTEPYLINQKDINIISITDNDMAANKYDYLLLTELINKYNPKNYISYNHTDQKHVFEIMFLDKEDPNLTFSVNEKWMEYRKYLESINTPLKNIPEASIHPTPEKNKLKMVIPEDIKYPHQAIIHFLNREFFPKANFSLDKAPNLKNDWNELIKNNSLPKKYSPKL